MDETAEINSCQCSDSRGLVEIQIRLCGQAVHIPSFNQSITSIVPFTEHMPRHIWLQPKIIVLNSVKKISDWVPGSGEWPLLPDFWAYYRTRLDST